MDAAQLVHALAEVLDQHRWDDLPALLADDFTCRYVHTGESFDRDGWVALNATYPGFERYLLEDCVGQGERAVALAHVTATSADSLEHYAVAGFLTARDGLIAELTEVWTEMGQSSPADRRPEAAGPTG
ncbi:MAG: nuclear transport factor 2 family protein [Motilibacteraceae bacterium]